MTIEIRQMVIKSSIDHGAAKTDKKTAGKTAAGEDESKEDCGGSCGSPGGGERQRMRAMLAEEFDRMRER